MNNKNLILLVGLISYVYLFNSLVNNNFYIIFTYFITLFFGYLIIKEKIYLVNFVIILTDIINKLYYTKNIIENNENNTELDNLIDNAPKPKKKDIPEQLQCVKKDHKSCRDNV